MKKNAIILSHLGMGDMIGLMPAIRKFCKKYKEVYIFSKEKNFKNVLIMYEDIENLNVVCISDSQDEATQIFSYIQEISFECDIITSGIYKKDRSPFENLPDNFYKDINLSVTTYENEFNLPERILNDTSLSSLLDGVDYNFIVGTSSSRNIDDEIISFIDNDYLIINPFKNHYAPDDDRYKISETFLDLPIFDYVNVIKNAKEIHLIDSAFCLLSKFVSSKNSKKVLYNKSGYTLSKKFFKNWEIR